MPDLAARPATLAEYDQFARFFPELGTDDAVPSRDYWERSIAKDTLLFEEHGAVVAYAYVQPLRDVGYVRHVVVAPHCRGRGVGGAVMRAIAAHLRSHGCSRWCLNVKPDNEPAMRLYRSVGLEQVYTSITFRVTWGVVARLPRTGRPTAARMAEPPDDAAIEAAFALLPGQIADARARGGVVLLCLFDPAAPDAAPLGFARFDPHYPGAFPYCVAAPDLAAPLLDAIRPHAPPEAQAISVTVEGDEALAAAFRDAGATVRMTIAHLRGQLPALG